MRVCVTGAGGFLGSALVAALAADGRADRLVAVDARLGETDGGVTRAEGDLTNGGFRDEVFAEDFDVVYHLAAMPGGAVARDPARGWEVNIAATFALFDRLAANAKPARLVFSSSIGVFGVPLPKQPVTDDTLALPTLTYGAHKLMAETWITDLARRGLVDGLALRLSGLVARPRAPGGHVSAYLSEVFHAIAAGENITLPVSAQSRSWFMSRACCVQNLIHAGWIDADRLGARRAFTLPALHLAMTEVVAALHARFGEKGRVHWQPDAEVEAQFGSYPPLKAGIADALGFRHDGSAEALVGRALEVVA